MNYLPDPEELRLWDTWVYIDGEDVHLFFLASKPDGAWDRVGHAVSRDWLHWTDCPSIHLGALAGPWAGTSFGTGMVFRLDGRYYMTYTGALSANEATGLLVSDDLMQWTAAGESPVWTRSEEPPYERADNRTAASSAWRDSYVAPNPDGVLEAFCCGRVNEGPAAGRGCIARARLDAVDRWETLAPVGHVGRYASMEVPEVFEFAGRYWAIFSTTSCWGVRIDTIERRMAGGTFYLVSDRWEGPYTIPAENLLIGAGGGRMDAYVARTIVSGDDRLVYHHYAGEPPAAGWPKVLVADEDRLGLAPWEGLKGLRTADLDLDPWRPFTRGSAVPGEWNVVNRVIYGACRVGAAATAAYPGASDVDITAGVLIEEGEFAGIAVGVDDEMQEGILLGLDAARNEVTVRRFIGWDGACGPDLSRVLDTAYREVHTRTPYKIRIVRRARFVELYMEDRLVFSTVLTFSPKGGGVACVIENSSSRFRVLEAYAIEPLARA